MMDSVPTLRRITRKSTLFDPSFSSSCISNFTPIRTRRSVVPTTSAVVGKIVTKAAATPKTPLILSQVPETPTATKINDVTTPKTEYVNSIMARIQKDLDSPSANARVRATKALKDPVFCSRNYGLFDVPHERQDLITEEERRPIKPKTNEEIFANVRIYVEVRTGDDNRSAGIKNHLLRNGFTVNEKLYKDTTHVIFKDGLLSSYKNAMKLGIPVTTILWADACLAQKRLVDPEKFKISNLDRYERPELYKRLRREKSMQPEISKIVGKHFFTSKDRSMTQDNTFKNLDVDTLMESAEEEESADGMELTLQNEKTLRQSPQVIDIDESDDRQENRFCNARRFTTFTPQPMEQTKITSDSALARRKTFFASQMSKDSEKVTTPENGFSANSGNTIVFNSSNKITKHGRRSVFDISMNILELNCKAISQKKDDTVLSAKKFYPNVKANTCLTPDQSIKPVIRKRKLFNNDNFDIEIENWKENLNITVGMETKKAKTVVQTFNPPRVIQKSSPKVDRRRTLAYFKTDKPKEMTLKTKTPVKPTVSQKFVVCTNMSSNDKKIIHAAIEKMGGKVETEVTDKTTHVVSPNEERTMNILRGVIRACVIVNVGWIHDSLAKNKWLETTTYQHDICDSNKVYERSVLGTKNYKNLSFANRGSFYLNKETIDNAKKVDYLKEVITLCGGKITEKKTEARYIVSDKPIHGKASKQIDVNSNYIFDSSMKGALLDVTRSCIPK